MAAVRVLVFNAEEEYTATLRSTLLSFTGVKIVAEVDEPAVMAHALNQFPADVLVANLDPVPEAVLPMLEEVAQSNPKVEVFAVSSSTDGQLILAAMRHGIREFLTKPIDDDTLGHAFEKVAERHSGDDPQGKLITVIGGAGGVGATTIAVNLAVELTELTNGGVAVVDLDHRFGQVATHLDVDPTYTMADLCDSPTQLEYQMIERALVKHRSGVQVLSRPNQFMQADNITAAHCVGVLSTLLAQNDYVVVDGPTRFDFGTKAVLDISDFNMLVLQLVVPTVRSVHRMLEGMTEVGFNLDRMKLVCNRVGGESGGITPEDVRDTLNMDVFGEVPDDWNAVNAAINVGEPLSASSPKSKVRQAIRGMAMRLHDPHGNLQEVPKETKKGGILSKIF
ncbi:MAG TPA: AAA family ATPase [Phycisphaerae bacterium]|nr:AAA family ATPase [Phycisphaerae bacterium]